MMKSAVSFSKTWMRENFRRYWIVPVLGFMGYFLSSILPVLLCYQRFDIVSSYASISISNQNPAIIGIDCTLAVLMAVCVFSYLHNSASVTVTHSFPSGRGQLFDASALSGFFMMLIPVAANGILMMSLSGAKTDVSDTVLASELFSPLRCLEWIAETMIIIFFVYALSVLAGVLAGNRTIHTLLALFLNGLPFVLVIIVRMAESMFLYGYSGDILANWTLRLSPVSYMALKESGAASSGLQYELLYLPAAAAVLIIARLVYRKVKLEREERACVFPLIADIICILLTFICAVPSACLMMVVLTSGAHINNSFRIRYLILFVIFSAVYYLISRAIADGITHVFNRSTLKKFGIYAVIAAVFLCFTVFDLSGYSTRTPETSDVAAVEITADLVSDVTGYAPLRLTGRAAVNKTIALQKELIDSREVNDTDADWGTDITITYRLKNGTAMRRTYSCMYSKDHPESFRALQTLFAAPEVIEKFTGRISKFQSRASNISLSLDEAALQISRSDWSRLFSAYRKDLRSISGSNLKALMENSNLYFLNVEQGNNESTIYLPVQKSDRNTMKFLQRRGYLKELKTLNSESDK